jgi:hypothetical protein
VVEEVGAGSKIFVAGLVWHAEGHVGIVSANFGVDIGWLVVGCRMLVVVIRFGAKFANYWVLGEPGTAVLSMVDIRWVRARVYPGDLSFLASCLETYAVVYQLSLHNPIFGF